MLGGLNDKIKGGKKILSKTISIRTVESEIAESLEVIQNKFKDIDIGSYPFFKQGKVGVSIVIRSTEENLISICYKDIEDFIKKKKIYSPINSFYKGTTLKFFTKKIKKIKKINIFVNSLNDYDEIIVIGSGKGVVSVNSIEKPFWKRKSFKNYRILLKIYKKEISNCSIYK